MLSWCAYCQQFQGEVEPLDNFQLSHGICPTCTSRGIDFSEQEFAVIEKLKSLQGSLLSAGLDRDFKKAEAAIRQAKESGVRDVDILLGLIAPLLWQIGDMWASGAITVAQEHSFTAFYNPIIEVMESSILKSDLKESPVPRIEVLTMVSPGNVHDIGARVLNFWLQSNGIQSRLISRTAKPSAIIASIQTYRPRYLGISVALPEHISKALELKDLLRGHFKENCPHVIIGGNALKISCPLPQDGVTFIQIGPELLKILKSGVSE